MPKKVRREINIPKATKVFTDREEPQKAFWDKYDQCKKSIAQETGDIFVLSYYGIGGIGKSALVKQLISELEEKGKKLPKYRYASFDFTKCQDSRSVLVSIRNQLVDCKDYKYTFPLFDCAVYYYAKKTGEDVKKAEIKSFTSESEFLKLVLDLTGNLPGVGFASKLIVYADKGVALFRNLLANHKRDLIEIEKETPDELLAHLPYLFAEDLSDNLSDAKEPLVIFLDTYECLVNEMISIGEPLAKDEWLRGEKGIIQNTSNVLWVITGREKLKWEYFDRDWDQSLEQHLLGALSKNDGVMFLENAGIADKELRDKLYELTQGTPVYLDLCVDRYYLLIRNETNPTIDDFGNNISALIERFARYMDHENKDIVYMLATLQLWNDDMLLNIAAKVYPAFSVSRYDTVKGFSFITTSSDGLLTIHKTVGDVFVKYCPEAFHKNILTAAAEYCFKQFSSTDDSIESRVFYLLRYIYYSLQMIEEDAILPFYTNHLEAIYNNLLDSGKFEVAGSILSLLSEKAKKDTKDYAFILREYALLSLEYGRYEEALAVSKQALEQWKVVFGDNHPATIDALKVVAESLLTLGKYEEALAISEQVLEKSKAILGENHPETIDAMDGVAVSLLQLGKSEEALAISEQALEKSKATFGDDHPNTIGAMHSVAESLLKLGKYEEALAISEQVLKKQKTILEDNHPNATYTMHSIAESLLSLGKYEEALEIFNQVLEKRKAILGDDHPETIGAMSDVAVCLHSLGKYDEALEIFEQVLEKRKAILGDNHPDTIDTTNAVAMCLLSLGKYKDVLEKSKAIWGDNHPNAIGAMNAVAKRLRLLGKYEEALEIFKQVLEKRKAILGDDHPETIGAMSAVARCLRSLGKYEEALEIFKQVLKNSKAVLGDDHPDTIYATNAIATCLLSLGKYGEAKEVINGVV